MDLATPKTVLGDFADAKFSHHGIDSLLYRRGDRYMVRTEGPTGATGDFEVKYVFGVTPLQQYMVEFDRSPDAQPDEIGRLQVLRIVWNAIEKKWFYLPPPDVEERILPNDDLHWTGIAQRWNSNCADCHSTHFQKNFDESTTHYHSTFSEIDVSCEACHGAGGDHVQLAQSLSLFWDRQQGKAIGGFKKSSPEKELATCFRCHSRRQMLTEEGKQVDDLTSIASPEPLSPLTHHCDGQIQDEVFEHGSFLQSRMYAKGIRCSDCHDPHSAKLKHQGNQTCTSCHQHSAGKYDSPAHHHHKPGAAGAQCIDCHMPSKTYMEIDVRRDHSLRVPRPDQSVNLGTPNACTGCHINVAPFVAQSKLALEADRLPTTFLHAKPTDYHKLLGLRSAHADIRAELTRLDRWAAEQIVIWYGEKRERGAEYAPLLAARWKNQPSSEVSLEKLAQKSSFPAIIRAAAWSQLAQSAPPPPQQIIPALKDPSSLVRTAACGAAQAHFPTAADFLENGVPRPQWSSPQLLQSLRGLAEALNECLADDQLAVRIEAARALAKLPTPLRYELQSGEQRATWESAIGEWKQSLKIVNDRGGSHTSLGAFYEFQERWNEAKAAYETAIHVEPQMVGPRSNLSILLERVADDLALPTPQRRFEVSGTLDAIKLRALATEHLQAEALLLRRDAELAPQLAALQYQYALALVRLKDYDQAKGILERAVALEPQNTTYLFTLALLLKERTKTKADWAALEEIARKLRTLSPENTQFQQLESEIKELSESSTTESSSKRVEK